MRSTLLFAFFALAGLCTAQPPAAPNQTDAQGRKQGSWSKAWPTTGKTRYTGQFKDDRPAGTFLHYAEDGKLATEQVYAADGRTSHATHYHPNGAVMARGKYLGQEKDSTWNYYTDRGGSSTTEQYAGGRLTGDRLVYHDNGTVAERAQYREGALHGAWKQFFPGGQVKAEATYANGTPEGTMTWYYPNGKKEIEGNVVNGERDGTWTYFNEDGSVQILVTYANGVFVKDRKMNGMFKEYYDDEQVKEEVTWKNGELHGPFTAYHPNGKWVLREVPADPEHGFPAEQERVLAGQTKLREGTYRNGLLDGEVKEYDLKGKLVKTTRYVGGVAQGG